MKNIAIFASGAGSNAEKLIEYFADNLNIDIALIVCNKPSAGVLTIAANNNVPTMLIEKEQFFRGNAYIDQLKAAKIDFIVLAGFLWKIPLALVESFPNKIINIHPALLPNYGGKGMYGMHVHEAIITNKETESGITIHYVDAQYDHGQIIFQVKCPVLPIDTALDLAKKIHKLEHQYFAVAVEKAIGNAGL